MDIVVLETCWKVTIECGIKDPKPSHEANIVISKQVEEKNELVGWTELRRTSTSSSRCSCSKALVRFGINDSFKAASVSYQTWYYMIFVLQAGIYIQEDGWQRGKENIVCLKKLEKVEKCGAAWQGTINVSQTKPCTTSPWIGNHNATLHVDKTRLEFGDLIPALRDNYGRNWQCQHALDLFLAAKVPLQWWIIRQLKRATNWHPPYHTSISPSITLCFRQCYRFKHLVISKVVSAKQYSTCTFRVVLFSSSWNTNLFYISINTLCTPMMMLPICKSMFIVVFHDLTSIDSWDLVWLTKPITCSNLQHADLSRQHPLYACLLAMPQDATFIYQITALCYQMPSLACEPWKWRTMCMLHVKKWQSAHRATLISSFDFVLSFLLLH